MAINPVIANLTKARIDPNSMERRMPVELMQGIMSLGNAIGGGISARKASKRKEEAQSMLKDISSSLYGDPSNYQSSMMSIADKRRMAGDDSGAIEAENLAALSASDPDSFLRELTEDQFFFAKQAGVDLNEYKKAMGFGGEASPVVVAKGASLVNPITGEALFGGSEVIDDDQQNKNIGDLRKEIRAADPDFMKIEDAFGRISASAEDPSAAGDLALIFNFMKVLDPGSTVREGEFATAQSAAGVSQRVRSLYNQVISGERLTDTQRLDFTGRAQKLFGSAKARRDKRLEPIREHARRLGIDPKLLFSSVTEEVVTQENTASPIPVGTVNQGYTFNGGNPNDKNSWSKN